MRKIPKISEYVSNNVFEGTRPLTPERSEHLRKKFEEKEQLRKKFEEKWQPALDAIDRGEIPKNEKTTPVVLGPTYRYEDDE